MGSCSILATQCMVCRAFELSKQRVAKRKCTPVFTNKNISTFYTLFAISRWLGQRLDMVSSVLLFGVALLSVLLRDTFSAGLIGVALVQGLQMTGILQFAVRQGAETESYMTSAERVAGVF